MKPLYNLLSLGLATLGLSSCGPGASSDTSGGKPAIVATTTMIADMVRQISGDDITLTALMGLGVDPHLYKPSAEDAQKLGAAKAIFYNGLMLEGRMRRLRNWRADITQLRCTKNKIDDKQSEEESRFDWLWLRNCGKCIHRHPT